MNQSRRNWRTVLGLATLAIAMSSVSTSAAEPKGGGPLPGKPGKDDKGHAMPGKPGKDDKAGPHGEHGGPAGDRGRPDGEHGKPDMDRGKHEHGGTAGAPGAGHDHHGMPGRRMSVEQRKARVAELQQKQASGKLTDEEKAELERAQKFLERNEALEKKFAERNQDRKNRAREAKREALKEYPNLDKDPAATAEYKKYAERLAKLERAKELATADDRSEVSAKVDELIKKEKERHQSWVAKHASNAQAAKQGAAQ